MTASASVEKTLPMTVKNTGFMVDRLGQDCGPLQFVRELTQNAIEAVVKNPDGQGVITWDVDWDQYDLTSLYKLCIIDDGIGMTGPEMVQYINMLSSSVHTQSHYGNFGVGAKIAAATRNHEGLIYLSWREGKGAMIQLWRDAESGEYGLRQLTRGEDRFDHWAPIEDTVKPGEIESHGTKVVLMGNDPDQDTMSAPEGAAAPSAWIAKYLNTRYFRFPDGVTVRAREGWTSPRADTDNNVLRTVRGQAWYLEEHSQSSGVVHLDGADAHWWILRHEKAMTQQAGRFASSGHMAALHGNELYELSTGRAGVARLQQFGVIFGHQRVVLYLEPTVEVRSNTARTQLLISGEHLPWAEWAAEFRDNMPSEINDLMDEVTAGASSEDHRQAIRERLRQIKDLLRISRYRPTPSGDLNVDSFRTGGSSAGDDSTREAAGGSKGGGGGGRAGSIYALFLSEDGDAATDDSGQPPEPQVDWVTVAEGTRTSGDLEDRAARYLFDQNRLLINGDFRVYADMIARWESQYANVHGAHETIVSTVREWFEQSLIEAVMGAHSLHGPHWTPADMRLLLSEEALTASVLPRYHIDVAVKRGVGSRLGSLKDKAS